MTNKPAGYFGKRTFDIGVLLASLPLTLPLSLATAIVIRVSIGSPVVFRQERAGVNGETFNVLKFRTMNASVGSDGKLLPDRDRITALGRVLRKTSLDELPQLVNVLRGDMSIVGPRPLYTRYVPHYSNRERTRLLARPGITGLAQVSGRNAAGWRERLELDAQYVETNSLARDLLICIRTALKVVRSEGVSIIAGDSADPLDVERAYPSKNELHLRRLYPRDLPLLMEWMRSGQIRDGTTIPQSTILEGTQGTQTEIRADPIRHDFALEDEGGRVVAITRLIAEIPGGPAKLTIFMDPNSHGTQYARTAAELTIEQARGAKLFPRVTISASTAIELALHHLDDLAYEKAHAKEGAWMGLQIEADNAEY